MAGRRFTPIYVKSFAIKMNVISFMLSVKLCRLCLQGVFIVFQDKAKPGKNYTGSQLFDTGGAFYNMPGYLDNLKVRLQLTSLSAAPLTMQCPCLGMSYLLPACLSQ